jgi:hypothetical protein
MITNSPTRQLRKELLIAQGLLCRQKTQMALDAMWSDLLIGTSRPTQAGVFIDLMAGAVGSASLSSLLISLVGDSRLSNWLRNIRQAVHLSQLAVDIFQMLSPTKDKETHRPIVRERTDNTALDE